MSQRWRARRIARGGMRLAERSLLKTSQLHPVAGNSGIARSRGPVFEFYRANRSMVVRRIAQAWLLLLIVGSLQPARPWHGAAVHRGMHWLAFGGLAFLLLISARNLRSEIRSVLAACLVGVSLESLQHLVYRKPVEWIDVRDDVLAILGAFVLVRVAVAICRAVASDRQPDPSRPCDHPPPQASAQHPR